MKIVKFYTKNVCALCDEAEALLQLFQRDYPFEIEKRDIYTNDIWLERFHLNIPVIEMNGDFLDCETLNYETLESFLKKHV